MTAEPHHSHLVPPMGHGLLHLCQPRKRSRPWSCLQQSVQAPGPVADAQPQPIVIAWGDSCRPVPSIFQTTACTGQHSAFQLDGEGTLGLTPGRSKCVSTHFTLEPTGPGLGVAPPHAGRGPMSWSGTGFKSPRRGSSVWRPGAGSSQGADGVLIDSLSALHARASKSHQFVSLPLMLVDPAVKPLGSGGGHRAGTSRQCSRACGLKERPSPPPEPLPLNVGEACRSRARRRAAFRSPSARARRKASEIFLATMLLRVPILIPGGRRPTNWCCSGPARPPPGAQLTAYSSIRLSKHRP